VLRRVLPWAVAAAVTGLCCAPAEPVPEPTERGKLCQIPFELCANRVLLPVRIGDSRELKLVLDTGMWFDGVIVYNPDLADSIALENPVEVRVPGAGSGEPSTGLMSESMSFLIGSLPCIGQRVVLLDSRTMAGMTCDGVVGWSLFGHYTVELDYDSMLVRLYEPGAVPADTGWRLVRLAFKDNPIPWVTATVNTRGDEAVDVATYIDFASGDAVELMTKPGAKFELPTGLEKSYLGTGLSGHIFGHKGRVAWFELAGFRFSDVAATFSSEEVRSKQDGADAIIGNGLLCRFNAVFDYSDTSQARLWIRPNRHYDDPF
jgi:hypothetical protein